MCVSELAELARHYGIPLLAVPDAINTSSTPNFLLDSVHPSETGSSQLAELLALATTKFSRQCHPGSGSRSPDLRKPSTISVASELPSPLHQLAKESTRHCFVFESPASVAASKAGEIVGRLLPAANVSSQHGWAYVEKENEKLKPGLVAFDPGASVEVSYLLESAGIASADSFALVEYLTSYEHMGQASVSCTAGCSCITELIDAHSSKQRTSIIATHRVPITESAAGGPWCVLRVVVLDGTSSGEHKFKLTGLLVGAVDTKDARRLSVIPYASDDAT